MDKENFIKNLIDINNDANASIENLEKDINSISINNDKDKANFGNMCVMLRGFRMVADATEAMLINEDVLRADDGNFYKKIEDVAIEQASIVPPSTSGKPGSDYDLDKNKQ